MLSASPVAVISPAVTVNEGQQLTLSAVGSYDADGMPVTIEWDLNNDGSFWDATGETVTFDPVMQFSSTPNGSPSTVRIRVSDWTDPAAYAETTVTVLNVAPTIGSMSLSQSTVEPGGMISVSGSVSDPGISDTHTYRVEWGDGTFSEGAVSPGNGFGSHTYYTPGDYSVSLKVTDSDGAASPTQSRTLTVLPPSFQPVTLSSVDEGSMVNLGAQSSTPVEMWGVNWGDGTATEWETSYSHSWSRSHTYADDPAGPNDQRTVAVYAVVYGQTYTLPTATVTVNNVAPTISNARLTVNGLPPGTVYRGDTLTLSADVTDPGGDNDPISYTIDWGLPGQTTSGTATGSGTLRSLTASNPYTEAGSYTITLTVSDGDGGSDVETFQVNIETVTLALSQPGPLVEGMPFTLNITSPVMLNNVAIVWGDGATSTPGSGTSWSETHTYLDDRPGENDVYQVTVSGEYNGQVIQQTLDIAVANAAPTIETPVLSVSGMTPPNFYRNDLVSLNAVLNDASSLDVLDYVIDWGDGSEPTEGTATFNGMSRTATGTHAYAAAGTYTITLTATDDDGGEFTIPVTVTVNEVAPTVTAPPDVNEGESFTLVLTAAANIDSWTILWGDGTSDVVYSYGTNAIITHTYLDDDPTSTDEDVYTAHTIACRSGYIYDANTSEITVHNVVPTIQSAFVMQGANPFEYVLQVNYVDTGSSADTHTYFVDWGDGDTSSGVAAGGAVSLSHHYADSRTYEVTVQILDDDGGSAEEDLSVVADVGYLTLYVVRGDVNTDSLLLTEAGMDGDIPAGGIIETVPYNILIETEWGQLEEFELVVQAMNGGAILYDGEGWGTTHVIPLGANSPFLGNPIRLTYSPAEVDDVFGRINAVEYDFSDQIRISVRRVGTTDPLKERLEDIQFAKKSVPWQDVLHGTGQTAVQTATGFIQSEVTSKLRNPLNALYSDALTAAKDDADLIAAINLSNQMLNTYIAGAEQQLISGLTDFAEGLNGKVEGLFPAGSAIAALMSGLNDPTAVAATLVNSAVPEDSPATPILSLNFLPANIATALSRGDVSAVTDFVEDNPLFFVSAAGMRLEVTAFAGQPPVYVDLFVRNIDIQRSLKNQAFELQATLSGDTQVPLFGSSVQLQKGFGFYLRHNPQADEAPPTTFGISVPTP